MNFTPDDVELSWTEGKVTLLTTGVMYRVHQARVFIVQGAIHCGEAGDVGDKVSLKYEEQDKGNGCQTKHSFMRIPFSWGHGSWEKKYINENILKSP